MGLAGPRGPFSGKGFLPISDFILRKSYGKPSGTCDQKIQCQTSPFIHVGGCKVTTKRLADRNIRVIWVAISVVK
ncbi:MAG: hypothetical protein METHP_02049 [Methanoregula sp. SKADARSKE-2]|nr:MAG: hypothetical protein METHP_02049 [Methanoregula sp. SKADARSKE-2]